VAAAAVAFFRWLARWRSGSLAQITGRTVEKPVVVPAEDLPHMPDGLVRAIRDYDAVAFIGEGLLGTATLSVTLRQVLSGMLDSERSPANSSATSESASMAKEALKRLEEPGTCIGDAELILGDVCEALGREAVARRARSRSSRDATPVAAAHANDLLEKLAAIPFSAIVSSGWCEAMQEHLPHRVDRNFGGFCSVLTKPRVDAAPGRSRPVMQLWPGLVGPGAGNRPGAVRGGRRGNEKYVEVAEALPRSRADCERELAAESQYPIFLRDLFQSKVVLFVGWPELPPRGHVGDALRRAWHEARARDPSRVEPLAFALACEQPCTVPQGKSFLEDCGLQIVSGKGASLQPDALGCCLDALAEASASAST